MEQGPLTADQMNQTNYLKMNLHQQATNYEPMERLFNIFNKPPFLETGTLVGTAPAGTAETGAVRSPSYWLLY